jgi:hypothetical protein
VVIRSISVKQVIRGIYANKCSGASALPGIFGVPLTTSVRYANVAISLQDTEGKSYVYGYVPIVVAKCGVFLKEKGTILNFCSISPFYCARANPVFLSH